MSQKRPRYNGALYSTGVVRQLSDTWAAQRI